MRGGVRILAVLGLVGGTLLGTPLASSHDDARGGAAVLELILREAAAQTTITDPGLLNGISNGGDGGTSRSGRGGSSGRGGDGGLSVVHDVGTADADASNTVIIDDVATGDVDGHDIYIDARGATRPVVVSVAGSFGDTGVDVFAPAGNAQAGTTGGNSSGADSSGGESGDAGDSGESTSRGGDGGRGPGSTTVTAPIG